MTKPYLTVPTDMERFIDASVASGRYRDVNDVVHHGLRLLEQIDHDEVLKSAELKRAVDAGLAAVERGETLTVAFDDIPGFLASLGETGTQAG